MKKTATKRIFLLSTLFFFSFHLSALHCTPQILPSFPGIINHLSMTDSFRFISLHQARKPKGSMPFYLLDDAIWTNLTDVHKDRILSQQRSEQESLLLAHIIADELNFYNEKGIKGLANFIYVIPRINRD